MQRFVVVAKFKEGVTQSDIRELIPAEQSRAKELQASGTLGEINVAMPKRTVFLELFGLNEEEISGQVKTLPFSAIWEFEIFAITPPAGVNF